MSNLAKAIEIAILAHAGQVDKAGKPYLLHPLRVMAQFTDPTHQIVAILHDVVEDSSKTLLDLRIDGFSTEIISALEALTKTEGEDRWSAAKRTINNKIASAVKLADLGDNMDISRIPNPTEVDYKRLEEYKAVQKLIKRCLAIPADPNEQLYRIIVDSTYYLLDGKESYKLPGSYVSYGIAAEVNKIIVDGCLLEIEKGSSDLYEEFLRYGQLTRIFPEPPKGVKPFVSVDYAKARCQMLEYL